MVHREQKCTLSVEIGVDINVAFGGDSCLNLTLPPNESVPNSKQKYLVDTETGNIRIPVENSQSLNKPVNMSDKLMCRASYLKYRPL